MTASFTDVQAICSYAAEEVAYYEEAFACEKIDVQRIERPEDLVRLPLLSPDALQRNRSLLLAKAHRRYPGVERLLEERSLGKLGFYQKTIWDMPGWEKEMQVVEAQRSAYYALAPGSRCCTFHTASYQDNLIVDPLSFRETKDALSIHNNGLAGQQLDTVYQRMMHFSPQYILALPCVAQQLAQYIQTHRLPPPPELRYIELTGEHLTPDHRALLWEVFHVHPTEAYSIKGIGRAAYACPQGHLHVVQENAFVEVLKNGAPVMEEEGERTAVSLILRRQLLARGFRLSQVSHRNDGDFFGLHPFPSFMLDPTIDERQKILLFNEFLRWIDDRENPELLLLTVPGALQSYSEKISLSFGVLPFLVFQAVLVDYLILCTPYLPDRAREFYAQENAVCQHRFGCAIDCIHMSRTVIDANDTSEMGVLKTRRQDPASREAAVRWNRPLPDCLLVNMEQPEDAAEAAAHILKKLAPGYAAL